MSSATQDQWAEICAAVRSGIAKQVGMIPAMTPGEVQSLVSAINDAMWTEMKASAYDAMVEEHKSQLERGIAYGG